MERNLVPRPMAELGDFSMRFSLDPVVSFLVEVILWSLETTGSFGKARGIIF